MLTALVLVKENRKIGLHLTIIFIIDKQTTEQEPSYFTD